MTDRADYDDLSDAELVVLTLADDKRAGAALLRRHLSAVHRIFLLNVRDVETAEDLTQETMKSCFERLESLANPGRFKAWAVGIAYNKLKDFYRTQKRRNKRHVRVDDLTAYEAQEGSDDGAFAQIANRQDARILVEALRRLPLETQRLLLHFYWDKLTRGEIAEALGIPVGTVGSRLSTARGQLRRRLAQIEAEAAVLRDTTRPVEKWENEVRKGEDAPLGSPVETRSDSVAP